MNLKKRKYMLSNRGNPLPYSLLARKEKFVLYKRCAGWRWKLEIVGLKRKVSQTGKM